MKPLKELIGYGSIVSMIWQPQVCDMPGVDVQIETRRLEVQCQLDAERTARERNVLGQFATPPALADQIIRYALSLHGDEPVEFLEPAVGSGSFFSALRRNLGTERLQSAVGVEWDSRFAEAARMLWGEFGLDVRCGDFMDRSVRKGLKATLLVANPPYVRHHHIGIQQKAALVRLVEESLSIRPSGLSGLYVYFLLLAHQSLLPGAISAWLIPSEFTDVNYGRAMKEYLSERVTIRRIHRFDAHDVQFDDALVTSTVVVFENVLPAPGAMAEFTCGGDLEAPRQRVLVEQASLQSTAKWSSYYDQSRKVRPQGEPVMGDYLKIRRGIATGSNKFFILPRAETRSRGFSSENIKPILPSPRHVSQLVIEADADGWPTAEKQLALIDTPVPLSLLRKVDAPLAAYLDGASEKVRSGYLVRQRDLWYRQEQRPPARFLCTYMGRGTDEDRPFRFLLNLSEAVVTNMFLMLYPTRLLDRYIENCDDGLHRIHEALLSITADELRAGGRVYGGGLHKMEPREFSRMSAERLIALDSDLLMPDRGERLI